MTPQLILASGSKTRQIMLHHAGLTFEVIPATLDERAIQAEWSLQQTPQFGLAETLAIAKASEISLKNQNAFVIGADQTLNLGDKYYSKVKTSDEAKQKLRQLRGKTHQLASAVAVVKAGKTLFSTTTTAHLTMYDFSEAFLETYCHQMQDALFSSVGCYQYEGVGIQLFDHIEGDYHTILGLPLLPLLTFLRTKRVISS